MSSILPTCFSHPPSHVPPCAALGTTPKDVPGSANEQSAAAFLPRDKPPQVWSQSSLCLSGCPPPAVVGLKAAWLPAQLSAFAALSAWFPCRRGKVVIPRIDQRNQVSSSREGAAVAAWWQRGERNTKMGQPQCCPVLPAAPPQVTWKERRRESCVWAEAQRGGAMSVSMKSHTVRLQRTGRTMEKSFSSMVSV